MYLSLCSICCAAGPSYIRQHPQVRTTPSHTTSHQTAQSPPLKTTDGVCTTSRTVLDKYIMTASFDANLQRDTVYQHGF